MCLAEEAVGSVCDTSCILISSSSNLSCTDMYTYMYVYMHMIHIYYLFIAVLGKETRALCMPLLISGSMSPSFVLYT